MEERYVTAKVVADHYEVCVQTIWKWVREGKLPAYRIGRGRNYRFRLSELPKEVK